AVEKALRCLDDPQAERYRVFARSLFLLLRDLELPGTLACRVADAYRLLRDPRRLEHVLATPPLWFAPVLTPEALEPLRLRLQLLTEAGIVEFVTRPLGKAHADEAETQAARERAVRALASALDARREQAPLCDRNDRLRALDELSGGRYLSAALTRLLPIFRLDPPAGAVQALPVGGYADLTNRGPFDRLVISELAYPEEEFLRRHVEGEQLYYDLEAPPRQAPAVELVLLDGSPMTWGTPRLAGQAAALAVLERARAGRRAVRLFGAAEPLIEFSDLDTRAGLGRLLDHQRWRQGLEGPLAAVLSRAGETAAEVGAALDVFVCTEAGRVEEVERLLRALDRPPGLRAHLFSVDCLSGTARLATLRDCGHDEVFRLELNPREVEPPERPARPPSPASAPAGGVAAENCTVRPEFQWGHWSNVTCASIDDAGRAVTGHANGDIHLWNALTGERIARIAAVERYVHAVCISGDHVMVSALNSLRALSLAGGAERPMSAQILPVSSWALRRGRAAGEFYWLDPRRTVHWYDASEDRLGSSAVEPTMRGAVFAVLPELEGIVYPGATGGPGFYPRGGRAAADDLLTFGRLFGAGMEGFFDELGGVFDEAGGMYLKRGVRHVEVRTWLPPEGKPAAGGAWHRPTGVVLEIPETPLAVNAACGRGICANGDMLWFWDVATGRMIARRPPAKALAKPLPAGMERAHAAPRVGWTWTAQPHALAFPTKEASVLRLRWDGPVRIDRSPIRSQQVLTEFLHKQIHGVARIFATPAPDPLEKRDLCAIGEHLTLASRQRHDYEFLVAGQEAPVAWFFYQGADRWALVTEEGLAAGTRLGLAAVRMPAGLRLREDPHGVGALLRFWEAGLRKPIGEGGDAAAGADTAGKDGAS
ncbi:MAG: hypothetical protein HZA54_15435, partial [Planctomycetes bacterium]|nr:hypothetical protein [Planctomycetota bacterium]